ncbi:MAG: chemotaxis protein CheC [Deltaproteobacteria bacterium]|nr:chemotaxis protein CheC [Deltaproteobacteria bacterium]
MTLTLTPMQQSALKEAGNIGSGHAANALSQLLNKKIMISLPTIEICGTSKIRATFDASKSQFVQICFKLLGDAQGVILFHMETATAKNLCSILSDEHAQDGVEFTNYHISTLKEIGNILTASYLNAISHMAGLSLVISVPELSQNAKDSIGHIFENTAGANTEQYAICIKTEFIDLSKKIEAYIVFVPGNETIFKILKGIGV